EERAERRGELAAVVPVVGVERREERLREGAEGVRLGHGEQQPVRAEVLEPGGGPPLQPADLERVARFAQAPRDVAHRDDAPGSGPDLGAQTLRERLQQLTEIALWIRLQQDVRAGG